MILNFIDSVPLIKLNKNDNFTVKFNAKEVFEEMSSEMNCEKCKKFYNKYLDLVSSNNSVNNDFKRWGFGIRAFSFETFQIRLNNNVVISFSEHIKDALKDERFTAEAKKNHTRCLTTIAANISYYYFQTYVNPTNSKKAKKVYGKRLNSFLSSDNCLNKIKDSWLKSISDIYEFSEDYIIIMEINIIIFLTDLSVNDLFKLMFDHCCFEVVV